MITRNMVPAVTKTNESINCKTINYIVYNCIVMYRVSHGKLLKLSSS